MGPKGTKNLQEQIAFKDIPQLARATRMNINTTLMKGRADYLCLHRYQQAVWTPDLFGRHTEGLHVFRGKHINFFGGRIVTQ